MLLTQHQSEVLNGLCSGERIDLMDSIDNLRSQGINHFVSLPQIIVCGDQSSGKSSVLEAISGVPFPIKSSLCTRFPTELVLRRNAKVGVSISIVSHDARTGSERENLTDFHKELQNLDGFTTLIEEAKLAMGISTHGKTFSRDLLRIEISGPDRPHLTIVDLPGLVHSQTRNQTSDDVKLIQDVVKSYMEESRSIILAIISAKNDYANQVVLELARSVDVGGNRTMGVITKPDTLVPGSESEAIYASLARNEEIEFRLGWHVLRNMDSDMEKGSLGERDGRELSFFKKGIWASLPDNILGINQLRHRLSKILLTHITEELPGLVQEIERKRAACCERLERLGKPRSTREEQQMYLFEVSQSFQRIVKSAVDANWNDRFFDPAESERGYEQRIRAVVQNLNVEFAQDMTKHGHRYEISDVQPKGSSSPGSSAALSRKEFLDRVEIKMRRSTGRELPGMFDPMIIGDLFHDQSEPWEGLAKAHIRRVWAACQTFLKHVATNIADKGTSTALIQRIIDPAMKETLTMLEAKTNDILRSHQSIHPITYNKDFAEAAQKMRTERKRKECASIVLNFFNVASLGKSQPLNDYYNLSHLVEKLVASGAESNADRQAASDALDHMQAYYEIAMKRFIDDIAVKAIEVCLVSVLVDVFSPMKVFKMSPDLVTLIVGESEETTTMRKQLNRQLEVLSKGADMCKEFVGINFSEHGSSQ